MFSYIEYWKISYIQSRRIGDEEWVLLSSVPEILLIYQNAAYLQWADLTFKTKILEAYRSQGPNEKKKEKKNLKRF